MSTLRLFLTVCTGTVLLDSALPKLAGPVHSGVFAVNENVSFLLHVQAYFLPTCVHISSKPLNLTLSQVNNGPVWAQEAAVPSSSGRLVPSSPPLLQPNLTGEYECASPGLTSSDDKYRLDVVGKKREKLI